MCKKIQNSAICLLCPRLSKDKVICFWQDRKLSLRQRTGNVAQMPGTDQVPLTAENQCGAVQV